MHKEDTLHSNGQSCLLPRPPVIKILVTGNLREHCTLILCGCCVSVLKWQSGDYYFQTSLKENMLHLQKIKRTDLHMCHKRVRETKEGDRKSKWSLKMWDKNQ